MKRSNRLLILLGILLAVTGAIGAMVIASGGNNKGNGPGATASVTPEPNVTVVVATRDIPAGVQLTNDMLAANQVPLSKSPASGTFTDPAMITSRISAGKIAKGTIIVADRDLLTPGSMTDGQSIATSVNSGMVAMSLEVDQTNGVGTLIVPGDHVDIVLAVWVPQLGITVSSGNQQGGGQTGGSVNITVPGEKDVTSKMVIQNRKVLATLLPPVIAQASEALPSGAAAPLSTTPIVQNTGRHEIVVVEVKPDEAEILRWAQREEKADPQNYITLSLALRSSLDNDLPDATTPGITFKMLVDKYSVLQPDPRVVVPADIAKTIQW